jgi:hypothetical protein
MSEKPGRWTVDHQIVGINDAGMPIGEVFAYDGEGNELRMEEIERRVNAAEHLQADVEALRAILSGLEWFPWPGTSGRMCLICHYDEALGHAPSCRFTALPEHLRGARR